LDASLGVHGGPHAGLDAWSAMPGQRAGVADVEVLGHDHATVGLDQPASAADLPLVRRLGLLPS
jgi:hypothetical protein